VCSIGSFDHVVIGFSRLIFRDALTAKPGLSFAVMFGERVDG
jgi:hypothetical protein